MNARIPRYRSSFAALLLFFATGIASAANPYAVNDPIVNPVTGLTETVVRLVHDDMVFTDQDHGIYVGSTTVGDFITDPLDDTKTVEITAVHLNADTGLPDQVTVAGQTDPFPVVRIVDDTIPDGFAGEDGAPERDDPVTIPSEGNANIFAKKRVGQDGAEGDNGWGLEICIIWCFTIGENAERGSPGLEGPAMDYTIGTGPIISSEDYARLPGVWVASIGGNGGRGGDAYISLGIEGEQGGQAGKGGVATVTSNVDITTGGDYSHGIFVQSRAGAGGHGGDAFAADAGGGGPPAESGTATATNNGTITTFGDGANGLLVQAIGGTGGAGGDSYGIVGVGGSASAGGHGGTASAINNGTINTYGVAAHGMVAQSIGGDGGDAGIAVGIVGIGGSGDSGGEGRPASVTNNEDATITTDGKGSYGMLAQSIGGGGGNGGTGGGLAGIGGRGAGGGSGGQVTAINKGLIITTKEDSHAIVAQSIGGGGGTGGTGAGLVGIGGGLNSGSGHGGAVTVTTYTGSQIFTEGAAANGVLAQSIGGGGGAGGTGGGAVGIGGSSGTAGNGGEVTINHAGSIHTEGVDAKGIVAQSIGGGGGSAHTSGGIVSLGGKGGAGGEGRAVTVTNSGSIVTEAQGAVGVLAQSIGGGGGDGGSSGGLVSLGGAGTSGGKSGAVTVTNNGVISTTGARAQGVLAQSIGGGGGTGGDSGGLASFGGTGSVASIGGVVTVTNHGVIETDGNQASAIEAESIGGGGGNGGTSGGVFFSLGGKAGAGGAGNTVTVNNSHNLGTLGNDSHGIFAQSVGGGGGNGGNSSSVSVFGGAAIGGSGDSGGAGSKVTIHSTDRTVVIDGTPIEVPAVIQTQGDRAKGIFAQSVGGGGGNGGLAAQVSVGYGVSVSVAVGGAGGNGGNGGEVEITGDSTIITDGMDSDGILAQSVGGGGGNGGFAVSFAGAAGDAGALAVSVGGGGAGGGGGIGGLVTLDAGGNIRTKGEKSEGIIAQSVGGGGGTGGFSVSLGAAGAGGAAGSVSVSVGGSGGDGGNSGKVDATFHGNVVTENDDSNAILLQGVGGGGGSGGFSVSGAVTGAGAGAAGVAVGVGGSGGGGGEGGEVIADITGDVGTMGDRSTGLVAQSVGGRGGNGAFNISGTISAAGTGSGGVSVGVGGAGGGAGSGKKVDATLTGDATTIGEDSDAVLVQSVGGGGGNGGFNVSGTLTASGSGSGSVSVGVGGSGGGGGNGGEVIASVTGDIATDGLRSSGFIAQSLGGGGGNGGLNVSAALTATGGSGGSVSVGVGGSGGTGGYADKATLTLHGNAETWQADSSAVLAQSVGGGGGNGGTNVSGSVSLSGGAGGAIAVGVGGSGGGGGKGGVSSATVVGSVTTHGANSVAITSQSIGGGGGNGGLNVSGAVGASGSGAGGIGVGVGGAGGTASHGDLASAAVTGTTTTYGKDSHAILVQSVGGGGGNGGINVTGAVSAAKSGAGSVAVGVGGYGGAGGNGAAVSGIVTGNTQTAGDKSYGVLLQSVGGGGGNGGINVSGAVTAAGGQGGSVSVGVGGAGGGGGNSSTVYGEITGDVTTVGDKSIAVLAQSLGGGGGNGGMNVSGAISATKGEGGTVSVGVGGSGGTGGFAQKTTLIVTGDVSTLQADSNGVLAQSVGGGGGNGGINVAGSVTLSGNSGGTVAVGVGGSGGNGGKGGESSATVTGNVTTWGANSAAITSQSIGGGGGNGGLNVSGSVVASGAGAGNIGIGVGGAGGTASDADAASATVTGITTTHGDDSHAILVQSVGGGGGNGGLNVTGAVSAAKSGAGTLAVGVGGFGGGGGEGKAVSGIVTGDAHTLGDNSYGVLLQSLGGGGGNGGINVSGTVALSKETSGAAAIGVGGFGGSGGKASTVYGEINGQVTTAGDKAIGVMAQSLGGGGGNGGINVSGAVQLSKDGANSGAIGIGGFGATGGNGDLVTLVRNGATITTGANADGIVAQSLGGGGGNGGLNVSGGISASSSGSAFSAAIGIGGFGGGAGNAGNVMANVTGDVFATGLESDDFETEDGVTRRVRKGGSNGVLAQSLGGAGGNGGINISGGIAVSAPSSGKANALSIGIGGFGGDGGDAGTVNLTVNADTVRSVGDQRFGIGAQSIGGGGGNGGMNVSGGIVTDGQLIVGLGGFGGDGGLGKAVTATANADVFASGAGAIGFLAQSVGGGGGNGGVNISGGLQAAGQGNKPSLVVGLGGFGGDGNRSDVVTATQNGSIVVDGADSIGVLAQSVAGGGGNGGFNVSGSLGQGKGSFAAIGIGGNGGAGADASTVTLVSDGEILVDGREPVSPDEPTDEEERARLDYRERANGILVQSIGGGGGNGGANITGVAAPFGNPFAVGVGGTGDGGGHGGAVVVERGLNQASLLRTWGNAANGLTAQSIGGGGGNAGFNVVIEGSGANEGEEAKQSSNKQATLVIGGSGGTAGNGNTVNVTHVGNIVTAGRQSDGIVAQSIGGGGGNANVNFGAGINSNTSGFDLTIGGGPEEGGSGNSVTVDHTGTIITQGNDATAIFAQSVGGGGGNAEADDSQVADLLTAPDIIIDVFSPDPKSSTNVTLGRRGGNGGTGGDVTVISDGTLVTLGDRAVGIRAQSVGNAGGVSGTTTLGYAAKSEWSLQIGLEGGDGGRSNAVNVTAAGSIHTEGRDAHAIQAQSVGGGGGTGGAVTTELIQNQSGASIGLGGTGGIGGVGGTVDVDNSATLVTLGDGAHGIYAQSVGGGGGDGGYAGITASEVASTAVELMKNLFTKEKAAESVTTLNVLTGGSGGDGAEGAAVRVDNTGSILTQGRKAYGVNAQSVGGGGGVGGMVANGTIAGGDSTKSLSINVGGDGGIGSTGAAVTVANTGTIHTIGEESVGIRAQSVGGGGGDAGLLANIEIAPVGSDATSTSLVVNVGGSGGEGGSSGDVAVTNGRRADGTGGNILTEGDSAHGIFAQSLGGGGGNGSSIVSLGLSGGSGVTRAGLNIGGDGGEGSAAGNVSVTNGGAIETLGESAHGVFAQSIGGGGGNGGLVLAAEGAFAASGGTHTPLVALGGGGGTGDDAGDVTVNNSGTILTRGDNAHGVFAQSIGGGGGNAGIGLGLTSSPQSTRVAGLLSALFGGSPGNGGAGGNVSVTHSGDITVLGNGSRAVVAESINGGGGHIALDFDGIASLPGGQALPGSPEGADLEPVFEFGGGGNGQQNSSAGLVTLNYTGTFGAGGRNGAANSAQSIGGGGGTFDLTLGMLGGDTAPEDLARLQGSLGGTNGHDNNGGDIASLHAGNLLTEGDNTLGLMLQTVGGGGGRANLDVSSEAGTFGASAFTLGGTNGTNESGGSIEHTQTGFIATSGAAAHGATLQSIGGGGGALTFMLQQEGDDATPAGASAMTAAALTAAPAVDLALGSIGGSHLDGAAIRLALTGETATDGAGAVGLVIQSIGGGGGMATVLGTGAIDVTMGGAAGASGNGGNIEVEYTGDVSTAGRRAHGVFLQSIGGGGGAVFTDATQSSATLSSGNTGSGGSIHFTQTGDIFTSGAGSYGLFAQSLGGGGGFVDGAYAGTAGGAGVGGAIELTLDGDVVTMGRNSTALFAQSAGAGGDDIRIFLADGRYIVGGAGGRALVFDGGDDNRFENHGSVMTRSGIAGMALAGGAGNDVIVNHGTVAGNVDLAGGANAFANDIDGTFYSGQTLNLGAAGNRFTQQGRLAPGAMGLATITNLSGSFWQSSTAVADLELDFFTGTIDSVLATGRADIDGRVNISLLHVEAIKPGNQSQVIFSGAAGLAYHDVTLATPPSLVVTYALGSPDATSLRLGYDVDFAVSGLKGNRIAIGDYINRLQAAGSAAPLGETIRTLVQQTSLDTYASLLTQLGAEFHAEQQANTLRSAQSFTRAMQDCGSLSVERMLQDASGCVWGRFDVDASERAEDQGFAAAQETARRYSQGFQHGAGDWFLGAGLNVERNDAHGYSGNWRGNSTVVQLGLQARRVFWQSSVGAALTLGNSNQELQRRLAVTGNTVARGERDVHLVAGVLDFSGRLDFMGATVTPALNLGFATVSGERMTETGAQAQDLTLAQDSQTHAWVEPSLAFGIERSLANRKQLRAYARVSALQYLSSAHTDVLAGFAAAPEGIAPMRVVSDLDRTHFGAEGGLELLAAERFALTLSYSLWHSGARRSDMGTLRLVIPVY